MNMMPEWERSALPIIPRRVEETWRLRLKLEETRSRYETAAQYRKTLQKQAEGVTRRGADASDALLRARWGESQALAEYTRALRIFTDLTVHGKPPEGLANARSAGA